MTPSGIEPATFRFVAQHLNHCANAVPVLGGVLICYLRQCLYSSLRSITNYTNMAVKRTLFVYHRFGHFCTDSTTIIPFSTLYLWGPR